jgi:4-hydroxybenzoate polyprenyltransferase
VIVLRQLRPYQWLKNLLLFAPLILAHRVDDAESWLHVALAFLIFSLTASAIYTINDLVDLTSDRDHPSKRHRPLASGELTTANAVVLIVLLLVAAALLSILLDVEMFSVWMIIYVATTTAYSFLFKRLVLIDVMILAGLYTLRIVAGAAAVDVQVSPWLLAFSIFLFSSLAFMKRFVELQETIEREGRKVSGRGYHVGDAEFVRVAGPSLGFLAVLIFALYVQSDDVQQLYFHPERLWLMTPILLYWIARMWLKAYRSAMPSDPILFAAKDPAAYIAGVLGLFIMFLSGAR